AERAMNVAANQRLRPRAIDRGKQFNGTDVLKIRTGQFAIAITARRLMRHDQVGSARDGVVDGGEIFRIAKKGPVTWKSIAPRADPNRQAVGVYRLVTADGHRKVAHQRGPIAAAFRDEVVIAPGDDFAFAR